MANLQGWTVIALTSINLFRSFLGFKYFQHFVIPIKQGKLWNPFLEARIIIFSENNNNLKMKSWKILYVLENRLYDRISQ